MPFGGMKAIPVAAIYTRCVAALRIWSLHYGGEHVEQTPGKYYSGAAPGSCAGVSTRCTAFAVYGGWAQAAEAQRQVSEEIHQTTEHLRAMAVEENVKSDQKSTRSVKRIFLFSSSIIGGHDDRFSPLS
jgi:hypothetical protein